MTALAQLLRETLTPQDHLALYTTGEGARKKDVSWLQLSGYDLIAAPEFARLFLDNAAGSYVYLGDQCYSGGFAEAMTSDPAKRVIAISAVDCCHRVRCTLFTWPFLDAFSDPANDRDGDGRVSEREAFDVAEQASKDYHKEFGFEIPEALYLTSGGAK